MPNVTYIGDFAFANCPSLTSIEKPKAIHIGAGYSWVVRNGREKILFKFKQRWV